MTKKFWKNWQKRIGETRTIWLFYRQENGNPYKGYSHYIDGQIQSVSFNGDEVTITTKISFPTIGHWVTENRTYTINRNDIKTIDFK